jgi:hypothetical protein
VVKVRARSFTLNSPDFVIPTLRGCDFFDFSQEALLKEKDLGALKMAKS